MLLIRHPHPRGQMLWCVILAWIACAAGITVFFILRRKKVAGVIGTSLAGAVAHNIGQMIVAGAVLRTPQLMFTYLPVLIGIGAAVGCLTGIVAERVFHALRLSGGLSDRPPNPLRPPKT